MCQMELLRLETPRGSSASEVRPAMLRAITVVIPVANGESTIKSAMRSTLADLQSDDRVLVYDDASTDSTASILREIGTKDSRVGIISGSTRIGVAEGLNVLMQLTATDLVARMDADDLVVPGRFKRQVKEIEQGVDVTFTSRVNFGPSWKSFRPYLPLRISSDLMPWLMLKTNPVPHSSMLGRTTLLRDAGFYRPSVAEDYDLWLRLVSDKKRLSSMGRPGIAYRMHPSQVTRSSSWNERFAADPFLRESFNALAESLGWTGNAWSDSRAASDFDCFVADGIHRLPLLQRIVAKAKRG